MLSDNAPALEAALRVTLVIAATGLFIILTELLLSSPRFLGPDGPVPWTLVRLQSKHTARDSGFVRVLDYLFHDSRKWLIPGYLCTVATVLGAGVGGNGLTVARFASIIVLLVLSLLGIRSFYGLDGAYHMWLVIFGSVAVTAVLPSKAGVALAVASIAVNACFSYLVSGVTKLASPVWRSGRAIRGILSTRSYGHRLAFQVIGSVPLLGFAACWSVMAFEAGFVIAVVAGGLLLLVFLVIGVIFHFTVAVIMGLNGFLFAFIATFPCVWIISAILSGWTGIQGL